MRLKGGLDEERKDELTQGEEAAGSILERANEALDKEHCLTAMTELQSRVEDWKGHKMDHFGDLLLYGNFTVLKGEGAKEVEREVSGLLFFFFILFSPHFQISKSSLVVDAAECRACPSFVSSSRSQSVQDRSGHSE